MRSPIFQKILDETPVSVDIFVQKYTDLVMRIHEILEEKGISQNTLAANMGKKPSEISKWLNGEHNFTLRSIAKLEAELGVELLTVSTKKKVKIMFSTSSQTKISNSIPENEFAEKFFKEPELEKSNR